MTPTGAMPGQSESNTAKSSPEQEYLRRREAREQALAWHARLDMTMSHLRTATAILAILLGWLAFGPHLISGWWLLAPILLFVGLMAAHERILQRKQRAERAVAFYDGGLRRLEHRWVGRGVTRDDFAPSDHPYAADLDLFGRGSLFDLLCVARTGAGQDCLAAWLLAGAEPGIIVQRQEAVAELRGLLDFREEIALIGEQAKPEQGVLESWGEAAPLLTQPWLRAATVIIGAAGMVSLIAWWPLGYGPVPLIVALAVGQVFLYWLREPLGRILRGVERSANMMEQLSGVMERIEKQEFECALLRELRADLTSGSRPPSALIKGLRAILEWLNLQGSIFFAPFARILLWSTHAALSIESWRRAHGRSLRTWLRVTGEFEALMSLASYSYEHPADPFPTIARDGARFEAIGLGHPLLAESVHVRNNISLGPSARLFVISGSNMSGKSTLLRTIGINTVLALAGGVVRAAELTVSPLQVGASLRTQDSLQGGISRFYAEILRLRQIVAMTDSDRPLLFLLDEILHGTNSHDRLIGAEAIVRTLIAHGAIGLITTHDLALAQIESDAALYAVNVHFEDQLVDGKMSFDYRLRPGVVAKSNALELMRAVGLDV